MSSSADALVDFALLDRGQDQTNAAEALLLAGAHRGLHVVLDALLEAHRLRPDREARLMQRARACTQDQRAGRAKSRDTRFMCRLTAAAFLRFRSWVGFS